MKQLERKIMHWKSYRMDSCWLADMGHTDDEIEHYLEAERIIDLLLEKINILTGQGGSNGTD